MQIELIVAFALLVLLGFLAAIDAAFSHISDVGLRRITSDEEGSERRRSIRFLREILENRPRFRLALSSTIQVLLIVFTVLLTLIISSFTDSKARLLFWSLLIALVVTVLFRQVFPRMLVRTNTEKKLLFLLPAIRPIYAVTSFFLEPIASRSRSRQKADVDDSPESTDEDDEGSDEDFQALMEVGEAEGIIEEEERELIETVVEFADTLAGEIMTPRTEIVAVSVGTLIKDARDVMIEEKYSRLPVYRDSIDHIEGMIYVRDLLAALATGRKEQPVETIKRDAFFVPESKTAAELLKTMQQNHVQIAVVIDEYGGVAGLVTVEDILEELVGEIEDEDTAQDEIIEIIEGDDGSYYDVLGSTEIDKIERLFDIELEDEDYTTIAGLVISDTGFVPKQGEHLSLAGLDIEILRADEKRIHLLRLRSALPAADGDKTEGDDGED